MTPMPSDIGGYSEHIWAK